MQSTTSPQPDKYPPRPVCVAYGDDLFLRRQVLLRLRHAVLGEDEGDILTDGLRVLGRASRVVEELDTMAMFGARGWSSSKRPTNS